MIKYSFSYNKYIFEFKKDEKGIKLNILNKSQEVDIDASPYDKFTFKLTKKDIKFVLGIFDDNVINTIVQQNVNEGKFIRSLFDDLKKQNEVDSKKSNIEMYVYKINKDKLVNEMFFLDVISKEKLIKEKILIIDNKGKTTNTLFSITDQNNTYILQKNLEYIQNNNQDNNKITLTLKAGRNKETDLRIYKVNEIGDYDTTSFRTSYDLFFEKFIEFNFVNLWKTKNEKKMENNLKSEIVFTLKNNALMKQFVVNTLKLEEKYLVKTSFRQSNDYFDEFEETEDLKEIDFMNTYQNKNDSDFNVVLNDETKNIYLLNKQKELGIDIKTTQKLEALVLLPKIELETILNNKEIQKNKTIKTQTTLESSMRNKKIEINFKDFTFCFRRFQNKLNSKINCEVTFKGIVISKFPQENLEKILNTSKLNILNEIETIFDNISIDISKINTKINRMFTKNLIIELFTEYTNTLKKDILFCVPTKILDAITKKILMKEKELKNKNSKDCLTLAKFEDSLLQDISSLFDFKNIKIDSHLINNKSMLETNLKS